MNALIGSAGVRPPDLISSVRFNVEGQGVRVKGKRVELRRWGSRGEGGERERAHLFDIAVAEALEWNERERKREPNP
jgi:hypothetical protein